MTRNEFMIQYGKFATRMHSILQAKSSDYAGDDDPFANFNLAPMVGVTPERGVLVRMLDKMSRIGNLLDKSAQVSDESILDTLLDLANYSLILACMLGEQNEKIRDNLVVDTQSPIAGSSQHCCPDSCIVGSCRDRDKPSLK